MIENCSRYQEWDDSIGTPCKCPVCGGFLAWDENGGPLCNKCGAELVKVPEVDEETGEEYDEGKICAISGRKKTVEQTKEERHINRLVREGAKKWKGWL
jgi:hypothetical protein